VIDALYRRLTVVKMEKVSAQFVLECEKTVEDILEVLYN